MFLLNLVLIPLIITCVLLCNGHAQLTLAEKHAQLARIWKTLPRKTPPAKSRTALKFCRQSELRLPCRSRCTGRADDTARGRNGSTEVTIVGAMPRPFSVRPSASASLDTTLSFFSRRDLVGRDRRRDERHQRCDAADQRSDAEGHRDEAVRCGRSPCSMASRHSRKVSTSGPPSS